MADASTNKVIGVLMIVLGALLLLGWLHIPYLTEIIAIALLVVGVLFLIGTGMFHKSTVLGVVLLVLGVLVLLPRIGLGGALASIVQTVVAVLLIIGGVLKLVGKW